MCMCQTQQSKSGISGVLTSNSVYCNSNVTSNCLIYASHAELDETDYPEKQTTITFRACVINNEAICQGHDLDFPPAVGTKKVGKYRRSPERGVVSGVQSVVAHCVPCDRVYIGALRSPPCK